MDVARGVCRVFAARARIEHGDTLSRRVGSAAAVAATIKLAASDPAIARARYEFDADPWLLNTPAGVVDLRSGEMRATRASDLFMRVAGTAPGGECPKWKAFLREITSGNQDIVDYIQRFAGYTLTGVTTEHAFLFLWGPGGNGKGVLLSTLSALLGDYATTASDEVFTFGKTEQHPTGLAALQGARLIAVTETEEGRPWAESRVKAITGGDKISARVMRGDPFEFRPVGKLWFTGNHKPVLRNPDIAMRRRMNLVELSFKPVREDRGLGDALLEELPGIMAWAIEGCLWWQGTGLSPPTVVSSATNKYFGDQDTLAVWLSERCEPKEGATTPSAILYADWERWASARGVPVRGDKWFSPGLERHYSKARTQNGMVFRGVCLQPDTGGFERGAM